MAVAGHLGYWYAPKNNGDRVLTNAHTEIAFKKIQSIFCFVLLYQKQNARYNFWGKNQKFWPMVILDIEMRPKTIAAETVSYSMAKPNIKKSVHICYL